MTSSEIWNLLPVLQCRDFLALDATIGHAREIWIADEALLPSGAAYLSTASSKSAGDLISADGFKSARPGPRLPRRASAARNWPPASVRMVIASFRPQPWSSKTA